MAALIAAVTATLTLSGFTKHTPVQRDYRDAWYYARHYAHKYRAQRDDLQRRLTRRVLEVRRLRRQLLALHRRFKAAPERPPHYPEWMCIHQGEGSWTDSGAPYWGGLQMDEEFMRTYGGDLYASKGTADHWTPLEQMWVAEKAWRTRGFWPWPNTARACGLL